MKKLLLILFIVAAVICGYLFFVADRQENPIFTGPCSEPITYKIGNINTIYNVTKPQLKEILKSAGDAWSSATGKNLFTYSEEGDLSVNLVYGDQQRFLNKQEAAVSKIRLKKMSYETAEKKLLQLKEKHEEKKEEYEELIAQYKRIGNDSSYRTTNERREKERAINQKRVELNRLTQTINSNVNAANRIYTDINNMLADYKENFGSGREFNQGNYTKNSDGETISIYSYFDLDELKLVLAHEMGHALGIGHVQNSKSVMFYLMKDQQKNTLHFTNEDIAALKKICGS